MGWYILRRLAIAIPTMLVIVTAVFLLVRAIPGNPVLMMVPDDATPQQIADVTHRLGLDQPIWVQYGKFLVNAVHLNFGESTRYRVSVSSLIAQKLPATIELGVVAAVIALVIGLVLGTLAGRFRNSWIDRVSSVLGLFGISAPTFWIGMLLIIYVGGATGWFPTGGRLPGDLSGPGPTGLLIVDTIIHGDIAGLGIVLQHLFLPALTLGLAMSGMLVRMTRSSIIEVAGDDYVRTARAKGAPEFRVLARHTFRNAMLPVVTVFGMEVASLLSGSMIVETVFAWPGMGSMLITAVTARDYPLIQGSILLFSLIFIVCNLLVDISYALIDPRIRY
ncbi:MAG TPA: ABC transporter permease [Gryllotalpicola sp.]